jgi:Flp pilus assembly protein TadG
MRRSSRHSQKQRASRRGIGAIWILAAGPVALVMFGIVADVSKIWLARVEVHSGLESAALAGAKTWGDGSDNGAIRSAARVSAQSFGQANTVNGTALTLATNDNGTGLDNQNNNNANCPIGEIVLGRLVGTVLDTTSTNPIAANERACLVRKSYSVTSFGSFLSGPYTVNVEVVARYDGGAVRLTETTSIICP